MISPTSAAPPIVHGATPVTGSGPSTPRGGSPDVRGPRSFPTLPATVPPPVANDLATFLHKPCVEVTVNQDLEPEIRFSNLRDPSIFDAVMRRSRGALLAALDAAGDCGPTLKAAIDALDRNAALRSQSRIVRNALHQG